MASITSLCELRWKINRSVRDSPRQNAKQRCDQSWMTRAKLTTSLQAGVNIEALPLPRRKRAEKRMSVCESRENLEWLAKGKMENGVRRATKYQKPVAGRSLDVKPENRECTALEKKEKPEENFNVGLKMEVGGGLIPESKDTKEKMEIDIVSMEGKDFLINALQKKLMAERDWTWKNENGIIS